MDALKIFRQVLLRHTEGAQEQAEKKFIEEGQSPIEIAQTITKQSFVAPSGEIQVEITDEEWDNLADDIATVFATLVQHAAFRDGVERMFRLVDIVRNRIVSGTKKEDASLHARRAQVETEELIASFSGREMFDRWMTSFRRTVECLNKDQRTREYLQEVRDLILDSKNAERVREEEFKQRCRKVASRGRQLVQEFRYADELNEFLATSEDLINNIRNDEFIRTLRHHAGLVATDLSYVDSEGRVQLDLEMLGKLRNVIVPLLAESFKYIPVPRIENCDQNSEYWVDNIVLCGYDVIPDNVRIQIESDSEISLRELETKKSHTRLIVTLSKICTELKNLEFYYKKKTFPELTDSGRATIRLGGDGATLTLIFHVHQGPQDKVPKFQEGVAHFNIHKFEIEYDKSSISHNVLLPFITNLFKLRIQQQLETEIERNISNVMQTIGEQLTEALSQINRPLLGGLETVRQVIKQSEVGQVYEKRREKLME